MSTANQQIQPNTNTPQQRQNGGGSLLNRANRPLNNQNPPQQAQNNATPAQQPNPFANQNTNNQNAVNTHTHLNWSTLPMGKIVVHFELRGLGDPFYRLLGHEMNELFGDSAQVIESLQQGGDDVDELIDLLDEKWYSFDLQGAALVYNWNDKVWKSISRPTPMPLTDDDFLDDVQQNNSNNQPKPEPPPLFVCLRAIDLEVVLNVLARARTQMILAGAPLVFSQQYLNRALVSDDPRLVSLVRATGYLTEVLQ